MSLLERRRAMMMLSDGEKSGFMDGQFAQMDTGSATRYWYLSTDSGRSFMPYSFTSDQVQAELVPDYIATMTYSQPQYNSGSRLYSGPIFCSAPSGSTSGGWSRLILRLLNDKAGGDPMYLAFIKVRQTGSGGIIGGNGADNRAYDTFVTPGANTIVGTTAGWLWKMEAKKWLDQTYPNHGCSCFAEWLVKRMEAGSASLQVTASLVPTDDTAFNRGTSPTITRICSSSNAQVFGSIIKSQFSSDDDVTYGIVQSWTNGTRNYRSHLITRTGGTTWQTLEQILPSSQSMGPVNYTASSFVMSDDGKTAVLFTQGGAAISKDYLNSFEWVPYTSMSFATSMSMYAWGAAGSSKLKTIYILDHNGNVFVSKNLCKSWKLVYQQPGTNSFASGMGLPEQDYLKCSSDGATCVRLWPGPGSYYTASTIVMNNYGDSYEYQTFTSIRTPRQFALWRNSGKYDNLWTESYFKVKEYQSISASLQRFFVTDKGKTATLTFKSGEVVNLPAVTKDPRYAESWSYATGSAGTNIVLVMAPGYTNGAWAYTINEGKSSAQGVNMANLNYLSVMLSESGSVAKIELEGEGGDEPVSDPATNIATALQTIQSQGSVGNVKFIVNGQTVTPTAQITGGLSVIVINQSTFAYTNGASWGVAASQWQTITSTPNKTISEVVTELMSSYRVQDATY